MELLSQMTSPRFAESGQTSLIIEGKTADWRLGPFLLEKLALSLRCEEHCCLGQVVGQTSLGNELGVTVASAFTTDDGFRELVFSVHETTGFMLMSAELIYNLDNATDGAYTLKGNASVVFHLPSDKDGLPAPEGVANSEFGAEDVAVTYAVDDAGNVTIHVAGELVAGGLTLAFEFTRADSKCWNGIFKGGSYGIMIKCGGIDLEGYINFNKRFRYLDLELNATLLYGNQRPVPGCNHTFAGNGSAIIDFDFPHFDVPRINFRMGAVGCSKYYEASLTVGTGAVGGNKEMVFPLGHSNLKIRNLGAVVSYIRPNNGNDELKVALVGSVGSDIMSNAALDVVIAFEPQQWAFAGVIRGPITIGGMISQLAPGVSVAHLDPDGHLGLIRNAIVTLGREDGASVAVAFDMEAFGVNCTARMVVGGDEKIANGTARVTIYVAVGIRSDALPRPLNRLGDLILGHSGEIDFVFALATHPITPTSAKNPANDLLTFLKDFEGLGYVQNPEVMALIDRTRAVCQSLGSLSLPGVGQDGFGPGVLAAIKLSSSGSGFDSLQRNVRNVSAFSDSMPTAPELELISVFNWNSDELRLLLKLAITHQITKPGNKHVQLESLMLMVDLKGEEQDFGFGMVMSYTTRHGQTFYFEGDVIVTTELDLDILLSAWSSEVWNDPLGISRNIAILFPVQFGIGINLAAGIPDYLQLAGGLSVLNERAYASVDLHFDNDDEAACFSVEDFDLHKLVAAIFCSKGDCLPHALEVLTAVSLQMGYIKVNSGAGEVVNTRVSGSCRSIPVGFKLDLQELDLFRVVDVEEMCVAVNEKDKDMAALVELDPVHLGPLRLTKSQQKQCQDIPLPKDGSCPATKPALGPLLMLHVNPKELQFAFDGRMNVLGVDLDACMRVTPSSFFADVRLNLSREISFDAMLAASYTKNPPAFNFEVRADLYTADGLIKAITEGVENLFHGVNVDLEKGAAAAKKALQKAEQGIQRAKSALSRAQSHVDTKLQGLLNSLHAKEASEDSTYARCKYYAHKCKWTHPFKCVEAGACWTKYGIIKLGLKIAETAVKAAKAVVDAALEVAQGALSAAQGVLEAAQLAVKAAVGAIELMERLVTETLKLLASLFDVKTLELYAALKDKSLSGSFHMAGRILSKSFDISFAATLDLTNIKTAALSALKSILTSIFGSVGKKEIKAVPVHLLSGSEPSIIPINSNTPFGRWDLGSEAGNISHGLEYFLPKPLFHDSPPASRHTGMVFTPSAVNVPTHMEQLCDAISSALFNIDHTSVYVDLSNLPQSCALAPDMQKKPCVNRILERCLKPGSDKMHARKARYHDPQATRLEISSHHKQFMGKVMQSCDKEICHELAHDLATDTWEVTFKASQASGSGMVPQLPDVKSVKSVRYNFDFSKNKYEGDIPDLSGEGLKALNLAENWLSGGLQNLAQAKSLESLDMSNNYGLNHEGCVITSVLSDMDKLTYYNFHGNDRLVPADPFWCLEQNDDRSNAGAHLVQKLDPASEVIQGLCSECDTSLQPLGCLGYPCMNSTLLSQQLQHIVSFIMKEAADIVHQAEEVVEQSIKILSFDKPTNGTGHYVTYTFRPTASTSGSPLMINQAKELSTRLGATSDVVANATACGQPGVVGPNCDIHCFYGWESISPVAPNDDSVEEMKQRRIPHCQTPVAFETCPNSNVVSALQNVSKSCTGERDSTTQSECLYSVQAIGKMLDETKQYASDGNSTWYCNKTVLNSISRPCVRAVVPLRVHATLCAQPSSGDNKNNKTDFLKTWEIVLISVGASVFVAFGGYAVFYHLRRRHDLHQNSDKGEHGEERKAINNQYSPLDGNEDECVRTYSENVDSGTRSRIDSLQALG